MRNVYVVSDNILSLETDTRSNKPLMNGRLAFSSILPA
jgi:hypothetical protein